MKSVKDRGEQDSGALGVYCPSLSPTVYHASMSAPQGLHPSGRVQPGSADAAAVGADARVAHH